MRAWLRKCGAAGTGEQPLASHRSNLLASQNADLTRSESAVFGPLARHLRALRPDFLGLALSPSGGRSCLDRSLSWAFEQELVVRFRPMEEHPCLTTPDVTS
jgi:hypothetical protein